MKFDFRLIRFLPFAFSFNFSSFEMNQFKRFRSDLNERRNGAWCLSRRGRCWRHLPKFRSWMMTAMMPKKIPPTRSNQSKRPTSMSRHRWRRQSWRRLSTTTPFTSSSCVKSSPKCPSVKSKAKLISWMKIISKSKICLYCSIQRHIS